MTTNTTGIILFAHGSRDPQWRAPIEAVALRMAELKPDALVRCSYLELCAPTLPDAARELIASGACHLKVFPLFLGVGKHAREDMPELVARIRAEHPSIHVELLPAVGESKQMTELMANIALASVV